MANLKNTVINDSGFLQLPSGTTTERPTSPTIGMMRYNSEYDINEFYGENNWRNGGVKQILVTNSMVDSVITTGMTTTTNGDINGSYVYEGTLNLGGCGNPNSAVFIRLKDNPIAWTKITCFFEMNGTASCWSFMGTSGFGEAEPATSGLISGGNIEEFSISSGDTIFDDNGTFVSNSAYAVKWSACDNNADNFFRFNDVKSFRTTGRRKDISNGLAGIFHLRSCNQIDKYIRVSQIYIW